MSLYLYSLLSFLLSDVKLKIKLSADNSRALRGRLSARMGPGERRAERHRPAQERAPAEEVEGGAGVSFSLLIFC